MAVNLSSPGRTVKWLRIEQDMTQRALADKANTSQQVVSLIETGSLTPRRPLRRAIAEALGVHRSIIWPTADDDEVAA